MSDADSPGGSPIDHFEGFLLPGQRQFAADDLWRGRAVDPAEAAADAAEAAAEADEAARAAAAAARAAAEAARAADFARVAAPTTAGESTFLYTTGARSAPNDLALYRRTSRNNKNLPGGSRSKSKKYNTRKCNRNKRNSRGRRSRNHKLHH